MKNILIQLTKAPDNELDTSMIPKIQALVDNDYKAQDVKDILDECVHAALASGFTIQLLDIIWRKALKDETIK